MLKPASAGLMLDVPRRIVQHEPWLAASCFLIKPSRLPSRGAALSTSCGRGVTARDDLPVPPRVEYGYNSTCGQVAVVDFQITVFTTMKACLRGQMMGELDRPPSDQ